MTFCFVKELKHDTDNDTVSTKMGILTQNAQIHLI